MNHNFQREWNGFWHFFNIMQFLPIFYAITETGIEDSIYTALDSSIPHDIEIEEDPWIYLSSNSDYDNISELINTCKELRLPTPILGFELTDNKDTVIAESELAWENHKIALLLPNQKDYADIFLDNGWLTITAYNQITLELFQGRTS
jgi:DEAD/DEAH box helicase domain-containing protein